MENKDLINIEKEQNLTEQDKSLLIDHDYDGIKELNNPTPPWLMWLFYISIFFSLGYAGYYHWFSEGPLQAEEYELQIAEANEKYKKPELNLDSIKLIKDEAVLSEAGKLFSESCAICHGEQGEGGIGPNLCDDYWIVENTPKSVFETIKNGTSGGMSSFKNFSDEKIVRLTSFILLKLKGSNPANPKEKEGTKM